VKRLPPAYVRTQTSEEFRFVPLPQLAGKTPRQTFLKYLAGCAVAPLLFITAVCVHGTWAVWGMCHTTQLHRACAGKSFQTGAGQNFPRLTVLAVP